MKILRDLLGFGKLTKEERELLKELQGYGLSDRVCDYYKNNVKNNKNDSYATIKKKIIRNIVLGKEAPKDTKNENKRMFYYGNLSVQINVLEKEIVWIKNYHNHSTWEVDKEKKQYIEKLLKIA